MSTPGGIPGVKQPPFADVTFARAAGREGGRRSAQRRRRLLLEDVERELGELRTPDDAERWLRQIVLWGGGGLLAGSMVNGLVRGIEIWLRAFDVREVSGRIRELERLVAAAEPAKRVRAL